jgi:hypothetical protein
MAVLLLAAGWLAGWLVMQVVAVLTELLEVEEGHQRPRQEADKRRSMEPMASGPSLTAASTTLPKSSGGRPPPQLPSAMAAAQPGRLAATAEEAEPVTPVKAACGCVIC